MALRDNLSGICCGGDQASRGQGACKHAAFIQVYWGGCSCKTGKTKTVVLGELLFHVAVLKLALGLKWFWYFVILTGGNIRKGVVRLPKSNSTPASACWSARSTTRAALSFIPTAAVDFWCPADAHHHHRAPPSVAPVADSDRARLMIHYQYDDQSFARSVH